MKREFFRFALAFFGRGVPTHRIKAWCKRLCCATVSRLIGHSLTLQFKLNSRVYIQSVSQSLSPLLGRRLKKSRHARPSDLATLFVQCRASKRLFAAQESNWTTKWRSKSAAPRRRRSLPASPDPGPTTQPQPAIDHYDAVSTFHDDDFCEARLPMLCTSCLELTTDNCR